MAKHGTTGKLIALYGVNNVGKTTQQKLLVEHLRAHDLPSIGYKYARYDIAPSGPILNAYLRNGNPLGLSPRDFQTIQAFNKAQAEPYLTSYLERGDVVVVEDYKWTSVAWGVGAGVEEEYLRRLNSGFVKEDLAILLDGERFVDGIEKGHAHESNNALAEIVRNIHLDLARELGWRIVNANQSREKVHEEIWGIVSSIL